MTGPLIGKFGTFEYSLAERYRFESELGRGGMGIVYRARDVRHPRMVAIKMLHTSLTNDYGVLRFQKEIEIAAQLQHPHIVRLLDSGVADGRLFYVMEYLEGESLRDKLEREAQLSVDEALRITQQVGEALQYAHDHGIVHRDVKPENIILADGRAHVVDFGLARALSASDAERLTASGLAVGTPHYMSPEQGAGEKECRAAGGSVCVGVCAVRDVGWVSRRLRGRVRRRFAASSVRSTDQACSSKEVRSDPRGSGSDPRAGESTCRSFRFYSIVFERDHAC